MTYEVSPAAKLFSPHFHLSTTKVLSAYGTNDRLPIKKQHKTGACARKKEYTPAAVENTGEYAGGRKFYVPPRISRKP